MNDQDALDLELQNLEDTADNNLKVKNRFQKLSEKVALTAQEKEVEMAARQKAESERDEAIKNAAFYADFADTASKYPNASEYKDKIREKFMSGYSVEDATVATLHSEGKFTPQAPTVERMAPITGGSAPTILPDGGSKTPNEMNRDELRAQLIEAEKRGDLGVS